MRFHLKSGSGKSTLISLLQRFYLPDSGEIKLDGHNIKDLNLPWLRDQMALVSQEPSLFTTSIRYLIESQFHLRFDFEYF